MTTCPACGAENEDATAACASCHEPLPTADQALAPGTLVGRYRVMTPLGRGGMGSVYRARDETLDEIVALKVLPPVAHADLTRRFLSEIRLARKISHRNVCRINEYGEDGGRRYIAMELVEGDHLHNLVRKSGPPPLETALGISIQMAEGLEAIHEAGIIHRDIKASNVMRDPRGVVKIMDLGVAKLESTVDQSSTAAGLIVGTPFYMSPEQAMGTKLDFRSDIYSLGVVMFELFTGGLPFTGDSPIATLYKHMQEPPPLERVPESVRAIVGRALAKKPEDRFPSAREVAEGLRKARTDDTSRAKTPFTPWPRTPRAADEGAFASAAPERPVEKSAPGGSSAVKPLAELGGLTSVLGAASAARDHAFPSRSRLSEPEFGQIDVFICYRRGDSEDVSGRIHDRLVANFGRPSVFKDVDSIPPGANFKKYLQAVVQRCLVQLVVIGRNWVDARDEAGARRLDDPGDWVRIEIEAALQRDVPIIPLLVHSASMPREQQLPPSLAELAYLQGASVRRDPDFHVDMDRLIAALGKYLPRARSKE